MDCVNSYVLNTQDPSAQKPTQESTQTFRCDNQGNQKANQAANEAAKPSDTNQIPKVRKPQKKHFTLTHNQKAMLKEQALTGMSQRQLAKWCNEKFGTDYDRSTISKILKRIKDVPLELLNNSTKRRYVAVKYPELEEALLNWVMTTCQSKGIVSDPMIIAKAKELAKDMGLKTTHSYFSRLWLTGFINRHNLKGYKVNKEEEEEYDELMTDDETDNDESGNGQAQSQEDEDDNGDPNCVSHLSALESVSNLLLYFEQQKDADKGSTKQMIQSLYVIENAIKNNYITGKFF